MDIQIKILHNQQWLCIKLTEYGIDGIGQVRYRYIYICKALYFLFYSSIFDEALVFSSIFMNMQI